MAELAGVFWSSSRTSFAFSPLVVAAAVAVAAVFGLEGLGFGFALGLGLGVGFAGDLEATVGFFGGGDGGAPAPPFGAPKKDLEKREGRGGW